MVILVLCSGGLVLAHVGAVSLVQVLVAELLVAHEHADLGRDSIDKEVLKSFHHMSVSVLRMA